MTVTYEWIRRRKMAHWELLNQSLIRSLLASIEEYSLNCRQGLLNMLARPGAQGRNKAKKKVESADKPGSVVSNHSSGTTVTSGLMQPTRKHLRARSLQSNMLPYLVLLQVGFTLPRSVTTRAVRSYRTISPLPAARINKLQAVYFLWHFPWARAPQALPGTLPAGARTFLPLQAARDCLADSVGNDRVVWGVMQGMS